MPRYLVMTLRTPQFQTSVIEPHYVFLEHLRQQGQLEMAGPFSDRSGGAYLLRADSLVQARDLAFSDPLHTSGASLVTVYEWNAT
ncbi:YciI family protein [Chitinimonas lacunae]|uniref:YciI family protein n=1 Tax=Chitinimonas lacunae TaxID=1963018 RepID=A0ABV8MV74_9NEIS